MFTPGMKKVGGRKKGTPNKIGASLKAAIIDAGQYIGAGAKFENGEVIPGDGGMQGYLAELAIMRPELYVPLLRAVLPLEISGPGGGPIPVSEDGTLKDIAMSYAQLLRTGAYMPSDDEQAEIDGVIEGNEIKLLPTPAPRQRIAKIQPKRRRGSISRGA